MKGSVLYYFLFTFLSVALDLNARATDVEASGRETEGTSMYVTGLTSGRSRSLVGGVLGLASVVIGWRARRRSAAGSANRRTGAVTGLVLGVMAVLLSVFHLAGNAGGFGTGGGRAGAIVALGLGVAGIALGGGILRSKNHRNVPSK